MSNERTPLDDFRRELEEDIKNFEKTAPKKKRPQATDRPTSDSHPHSSSSHQQYVSSSRSYSHESKSHPSHHNTNHASSKKKKAKKKWPRVLCAILALVLILAIGSYGFIQWELGRIQRDSRNEVTDEEIKNEIDTQDHFGLGEANANTVNDPNVTNILLIGQDRRTGDKAEMRSDAMIICSINKKTKNIGLTSLMRDMYLPIPGYGYGMLNSTYLIGGFDLLNETIKKNFGIPIHGNVEVDFDRFLGLMDILGSLDLNLTEEEATFLNNMQGTNWAKASHAQFAGDGLTTGVNSLNSKQVLLYCRMRYNVGGDWGRTDRQRKVIMASFDKLKNSGAKSILTFVHQAMPLLTTNMSNTSIIKLAYAVTSYRMSTEKSHRLPYEGSYTQEVREETLHVLIPDIRANRAAIQDYIYNY